jgi:hypothetical protein
MYNPTQTLMPGQPQQTGDNSQMQDLLQQLQQKQGQGQQPFTPANGVNNMVKALMEGNDQYKQRQQQLMGNQQAQPQSPGAPMNITPPAAQTPPAGGAPGAGAAPPTSSPPVPPQASGLGAGGLPNGGAGFAPPPPMPLAPPADQAGMTGPSNQQMIAALNPSMAPSFG